MALHINTASTALQPNPGLRALILTAVNNCGIHEKISMRLLMHCMVCQRAYFSFFCDYRTVVKTYVVYINHALVMHNLQIGHGICNCSAPAGARSTRLCITALAGYHLETLDVETENNIVGDSTVLPPARNNGGCSWCPMHTRALRT